MSKKVSYLEFVRSQPCACQPCVMRSEAHHSTVGERNGHKRGKGQKADDSELVAVCAKHHRQFHDLTGYFAGWEKGLLASWQRSQVKVHRDRYEAEFGEQPKQRVKPSKILPRLPVVPSEPPAVYPGSRMATDPIALLKELAQREAIVCLSCGLGQNRIVDAVSYSMRGPVRFPLCGDCVRREQERGNLDALEPVEQPYVTRRIREELARLVPDEA